MCTNVIKKRHSTAQKCSTQDGLQDPYCLGMNVHFCLHVWQMTHATTIVIPTQPKGWSISQLVDMTE